MIYVVSDIHGHLDKFKALLDMINFNDDDFMYNQTLNGVLKY